MIHVVQCQCANEHTITAVAWDDTGATFEWACKELSAYMKRNHVNGHCHLCGSEDFIFQDYTTHFENLEEAKPFILKMAIREAMARALHDAKNKVFPNPNINN